MYEGHQEPSPSPALTMDDSFFISAPTAACSSPSAVTPSATNLMDDSMDFGLHHSSTPLNVDDDEDFDDEDDNLHRRPPQHFCYDADASNDSTEHNLSSSHEDNDHHEHLHNNHHHHQDRRRFNAMRHLHHHPPRPNHPHLNALSSPSVSTSTGISCSNVLSKDKSLHSSSSSSSTSSMEVVSTDSHQRGFGEAAARGAKATTNTPFVPIFEETVFLESPGAHPSLPSVSTSSPISGDSWMNYSSNSSDDYTSLSTAVRNSISLAADGNHDSHSDDDHSDHSLSTEPITPQKIKRNFEHLVIDHENNSDASCSGSVSSVAGRSKAELSLCADGSETVIPKRHRGKDNISSKLLASASSAVPIVGKRRPPPVKQDSKTSTNSSRRNSSATHTSTGVDIRMIDFAHTAFMRQSGDVAGEASPIGLFMPDASKVHHQGPDNGFLRGLDSLKRLLTEICEEGH